MVQDILKSFSKTVSPISSRIRSTMREVGVPKTVYWGAQTGRSLTYFAIEKERLPIPFIYAFALQKKEATLTNIEDNIP